MTAATRNGAFPTDARSAALLYMQQGLSPVAFASRSKGEGLPAGWEKLRLTPDVLDDHFPRDEEKNIGNLNGEPSGNHHDVDLDVPEARAAAALLLPDTGWVFGRKSSPGSHRIYHTDRPLDSAQVKYTDLDGTCMLELRGNGGMTVFPPSLHQGTGERITWERHDNPADVPLADLERAVKEVAAAALIARHWPGKGRRDDASMALSGGLLRHKWGVEKVSRFVEAVATAAGDDEVRMRAAKAGPTSEKIKGGDKTWGFKKLSELLNRDGDRVVSRVIEWLFVRAAKTGKKPARVLEPYTPFPVEALPPPLAEYVRQGGLALGCDPVFVALPALAVLASVIGNTRVIKLKRGWVEPSVVWSVIVGDSGTLKSPAYLLAIGYIFRRQRQLRQEFKAQLETYTEDLAEYKTRKKAFKDGKGEDPGDPPDKPVLRRIITSDVTIEKLGEILEDNARGTLAARDELAGWLSSFARYKGKQGGSDLPNWLEFFRAGTAIIDRKTGERPSLFIERAAVSVCGGIQPGVLAHALTQDFLDAGLAARLLMAMPTKLPKQWSEMVIDEDTEQEYHGLIDSLMKLEFRQVENEREPHVLHLSEGAKAAWVRFYNAWGKEQGNAEGELAAAYSKLEAYAARFALLHHVISHVARDEDDLVPVGEDSVAAGVALCHWCARETRRIYAMLTESAEERDTRRLVEFIRAKGGRITARGLQRSNSRKYADADQAEAALNALAEAGVGRWVDAEQSAKGGRPSRCLELCPTHDNTDTTPGDDHEDEDGTPDAAPDAAPDRTADTTENAPRNRGDFGVPSVLSCVGQGIEGAHGGNGAAHGAAHGAETASEVLSGAGVGRETSPRFRLIHDPAGLDDLMSALDDADFVAVDTETTGLDPRSDRVRLLSLCVGTFDGGSFSYLVDVFKVDPASLWDRLAGKDLVLHNAAFDLAFLGRLGFTPGGKVHDTLILAQLLTAGTREPNKLGHCCERYLGRTLDKTEQLSDWTGELSAAQVGYAARDVEVLAPLLKALNEKIAEAGLERVAEIETRCLPAVAWMGQQGVGFDRGAWQALAAAAGEEAGRLRAALDQQAPDGPDALFTAWSWDSPEQVRQALTRAGCAVENTDDDTLARLNHPLADLLRQYRQSQKKVTTYGDKWLKHVAEDGRVYAGWKQMGAAASGRMSCTSPNMQQLPRGEYRRCVVAPPGRVLVKADYSQIELRIAAKVSGDKALLEAYQRGEDLHTITARKVLGIEEVTPQHRQLAKALNFGLLYGMGAEGFRNYAKAEYGLDLSLADATRYRKAFFQSYPALAGWHKQTGRTGDKPIATSTLAGRRRLEVTRFTEKLNTPVQGTGADGLKLALGLLWEYREEVPGAFPVLAVHDEIVIECGADQAGDVEVWLRAAMVRAMAPLIAPVPVEVSTKVAQTWGGD